VDRLTTRLDPSPIERQLDAALEAICAALVTLESVSVSETESTLGCVREADSVPGLAIEHLRTAARELRRARDARGAAFIPGFVLRRAKS
jgi:hypothetical protein